MKDHVSVAESRDIVAELRSTCGEWVVRPEVDRFLIRQSGTHVEVAAGTRGALSCVSCGSEKSAGELLFSPGLSPDENAARLLAYLRLPETKLPKCVGEVLIQTRLKPVTAAGVVATQMFQRAEHAGSKEMCLTLIRHVESAYPEALFFESYRNVGRAIRPVQLLFRPPLPTTSKFFVINTIGGSPFEDIEPPYLCIEVQGTLQDYAGLKFARTKQFAFARLWGQPENMGHLQEAMRRSWNRIMDRKEGLR